MKRAVLIMITVGMIFSGCNNFLDEEPDARAKVESYADVKELLVSAYPQATYHLINEMMSDNVVDMGKGSTCVTAITDEEMYYWKDGTDDDTDSPFAVWTGWYAGIAAANHALQVIEKSPDTPEYRALKGEALLCRALGHFLLVNLFAEHYDPATAETALGVPYVKEPETVAVKYYTRNTMQECYDYMEEDIRRGIALIDDNTYDQPKYHFTGRAAHAFAARFYTYKGTDWEKVLYHANLAIPENFGAEMRNLRSMKGLDPMVYARQYTMPSESAILLSVAIETYWNDIYATCPPRSSVYNLSPTELWSIIPLTNGIAGPWCYKNMGSDGSSTEACMIKSFGYFKNESMNSNRGMTWLNVPMFTVEEVAFNRMEAYTMQGNFVLALRDLNTFIHNRVDAVVVDKYVPLTLEEIIEYYGDNGNGGNLDDLEPHYKAELQSDVRKMRLMKCICQLRRMEFLQEGMRWFDIKRFHLPVVHNIHWERKDIVLERHDKRRALQIPQEAQKIGVVPNER